MKRNISNFSVYLQPILYIILTIYFALELQVWEMFVVLLFFIVGRIVGKKLNIDNVVKKTKGKLHYNRHPIIFTVWIVALIARISVEFFFKTQTNIFVATCLLAAATGMIIAESKFIHLELVLRKKNAKK